MDTMQRRVLDGFVTPFDVLLVGAREASNSHCLRVWPALSHSASGLRHARDGLEISLRRDGKSSLTNVHAKARELFANLHLFISRQCRSWRLLAIPQGGVEYPELVGGGRLGCGGGE